MSGIGNKMALTQHVIESLGGGHRALTGRQGWHLGFAAVLEQVVEADSEVSQCDHVAGRFGGGDTAGVLAQGDSHTR